MTDTLVSIQNELLELVVIETPVTTLITEEPISTVVTTDSNSFVVETTTNNIVVTSQGQQGPQGPAGASTTFIYVTAGQDLGGNRVVSTNSSGNLVYPDLTQQDQTVIGITTGAVLAGALTEVQIAGIQTEPGWSWLPGLPIFVGALGTLTQQVPVSNTVLQIARPVTQTKIFIGLQQPIYLE